MKQKLLLICIALLCTVGSWAYTSQTPSAGNTYYLYHPDKGQFLFAGENKYGVTPSVFNATPIYVETGGSGNSNTTFSFVIRGTKYYIYQDDGNSSFETSKASEFEPKLSGDKYRLQTQRYTSWGTVYYRMLHAGTSGDQCNFPGYTSSGSDGYEWQFISESEVESARSAMAESCASSAASYATTSNGWERVTSISALQTNPENYYYAIFCANATGLMLQATSNNSETQKLYYRTATNPTNSSEYLFEIENHTSGGFALKSFAIGKYFSNATSYDFHANQTSATAGNYTNLTLTYTNGAYTIETAQSTNFVGLWTIISDWYSANKYLAGNKESSLAGKFLIYRLPKQRLRNVSFTANITNPSFETGDKTGWTTNSESSDTNVHAASGTYATTGTDGTYLFNTWWQGVPLSQTIGSIPNGKYRITVSLAGSDDGKDGKYFLLAEGSHSDVITITQGTKGTFNNYSYDFIVSDNSATIGVVGGNDDGSYNENGHWWYKADNFRLTYIGQLLSEGVGAFTSPSAVTNDAWYNYTVGSAGWYVITSSAATTLSYTTDATKSVGDGGFSTLELAAGVSKCLELTNDPLYFKSSAAATLTITALTSGMDVTSLVTNTTFDSDISGWTATGGFQNSQTASNQSGDFTGNFWENWNGSAKVNKMYQNITNVPNGFYKMKIAAFVNNLAENNSTQYVFVNGGKTYLVTNSPKFYEVWGQVSDNTLSIGLEQTTATANWMGIDNVSLTYSDALPASVTPVTGKMNATVESAQTSAVAAYAASQTVANINAAMKAKAAAEVSKAAYAKATTYLESVEALLATTNFYTPDAYNSVYGTYKTAYDAGTLDDATAAGLTYKVAGSGGTERYDKNTANDLLIPGWTFGGNDASTSGSGFYINTWSTEDNSNGFANPFYEYWVADNSVLGAKKIVGTLSGLTANEYYKVTAKVRVRETNSSTKVANSITMQVGSGDKVDVTAGTQISTTQRYVGQFSAIGQADEDGNLVLTFDVASGSNISWLSFRDVNYSDPTPEAKAVLLSTINDANTLYNSGANVGSGVFQIPTAAGTTFSNAIATAQGVYDNASSTYEEVLSANSTLKTAITTYEGVTLNAPTGVTRYKLTLADRGTLTYQTASTEGGYGMPFKAAGDYMAQTFTFTQVSGNTYTMSFEDFDGNTRYICTRAQYGEGGTGTYGIRSFVAGEDGKTALRITIQATSTANVFNMLNTECDNKKLGSNGGDFYTDNAYTSWSIAEATQAEVTVSCKAGKYGTVIFPFTPDVSEGFVGITFYSCEDINTTTNNVLIESVDEPQANTPYIIKNANGSNFSTILTGWGTSATTEHTAGLLTGVYTNAYIPMSNGSNSYYVLQTKDDVQAFYKVEDDDFPGTPYKCYLTLPATHVKAFLFPESPTAINAIETAENENTEIYNLAGQRLSKAQRGINIVNGKKVMYK